MRGQVVRPRPITWHNNGANLSKKYRRKLLIYSRQNANGPRHHQRHWSEVKTTEQNNYEVKTEEINDSLKLSVAE